MNPRQIGKHLQQCLDVWSSGEDSVRIAAFLAIRMLANASDDAMLDLVMKVRALFSCTMPSLMTAVEHVP